MVAPPIHDDGGHAEQDTDGCTESQHDDEMSSRLSERGLDLGWGGAVMANANTAFKKKLAAVIATMATMLAMTIGPLSSRKAWPRYV